MNRLSVKPFLPTVVLVIVFTMFMVVLLNYFKFESTFKKLQQSRVSLIVNETHDAMEQVLSLGTRLGESSALEALIERQLKADSLIRIVDIADEQDRIIFSTSPDRKGRQLEQEAAGLAARSGSGGWLLPTERHFVTGRSVFNSFGALMGKIVISYDRTEFDRKTSGLLAGIRQTGFLVTLVCLAIALLGLVTIAARVSRDFNEAQRCLEGGGNPGSGPGAPTLAASVCMAMGQIAAAQSSLENIGAMTGEGGK
jgi:hypothetical protein